MVGFEVNKEKEGKHECLPSLERVSWRRSGDRSRRQLASEGSEI